MIYNGGLMLTRLRYFDVERRRPGLPEGVAALVESLEAERTVVRLVNTSAFAVKKVLIQAGMFGEHRFTEVRYRERISNYPAPVVDYAPESLQSEERRAVKGHPQSLYDTGLYDPDYRVLDGFCKGTLRHLAPGGS